MIHTQKGKGSGLEGTGYFWIHARTIPSFLPPGFRTQGEGAVSFLILLLRLLLLTQLAFWSASPSAVRQNAWGRIMPVGRRDGRQPPSVQNMAVELDS